MERVLAFACFVGLAVWTVLGGGFIAWLVTRGLTRKQQRLLDADPLALPVSGQPRLQYVLPTATLALALVAGIAVWLAFPQADGVVFATDEGRRIQGAVFAPSSDAIVAIDGTGEIGKWSVGACGSQPHAAVVAPGLRFASFSPDGSRFVTAGTGGRVQVWDAVTGRPVLTLAGHGDDVKLGRVQP